MRTREELREDMIDLIVMSIDVLPMEQIYSVFTTAKSCRLHYTGPLIEQADRKFMTVKQQEWEILTVYRSLEPKYKLAIYKTMLDNQASQEEKRNKLIYHDGVISLPEYRRCRSGRRREH